MATTTIWTPNDNDIAFRLTEPWSRIDFAQKIFYMMVKIIAAFILFFVGAQLDPEMNQAAQNVLLAFLIIVSIFYGSITCFFALRTKVIYDVRLGSTSAIQILKNLTSQNENLLPLSTV